jgi:hypothetical protein
MARELSPKAAGPKPREQPALEPGFLGWLRRRLAGLYPRTWRHWAVYVLVFLLAVFLLFEYRSATTYSATVLVTTEENVIGISPYTDRLDFGDLPQGGSATVPLTLENNSRVPTRFFIIATGDVRQFVRMSDAFFVLDPGESKEVTFTAAIPGTTEPKRYSGNVRIFKTPWPPWP